MVDEAWVAGEQHRVMAAVLKGIFDGVVRLN